MSMDIKKERPLLSVVMAARNEERYIGLAIDSILAQTFQSWELILIDDGSTDATIAIIERYCKEDKRIRLERNVTTKGLAYSLNKGVELAKSDIIVRADADDLNLSNRFEEQFEFLQRHPEIDFVGTGVFFIDEEGLTLGQYHLPEVHDDIASVAYSNSCFFHPSVALRRGVLIKIGLYNVTFMRAQDKELWIRGLKLGCRYANLRRPLVKYRITSKAISFSTIYKTTISLIRIGWRYKIRYWWLHCSVYLIRQLLLKNKLYIPRSFNSKY